MRKGESLSDVIKKRNITQAEMKELNPGVNLDRLKGERGGGRGERWRCRWGGGGGNVWDPGVNLDRLKGEGLRGAA